MRIFFSSYKYDYGKKDWGYSFEYLNFYKTLTNIKNVNNLELAWQYQTGIRATFQATPLVYKGIMYVSLPFNNVIALGQ